ncbi:MAG TPA: hypothetical protein ENN22_04245 [bacterium]|nr:hypothetical protein [bacterium]
MKNYRASPPTRTCPYWPALLLSVHKTGGGFRIKSVQLTTNGGVQGISENKFVKFAEDAKDDCQASQTLKSIEISVEAKLDMAKK